MLSATGASRCKVLLSIDLQAQAALKCWPRRASQRPSRMARLRLKLPSPVHLANEVATSVTDLRRSTIGADIVPFRGCGGEGIPRTTKKLGPMIRPSLVWYANGSDRREPEMRTASSPMLRPGSAANRRQQTYGVCRFGLVGQSPMR